MDEKIVGQIPVNPEEGNQEVSLPETEQKPTETEEVGALPEGVSERTRKEFEKLKAHNKELSDKLRGYEVNDYGDVFNSLRGPKASTPEVDLRAFPNLNQQQVESISNKFVDEYGNVDVEAFNRALASANATAKQAATEAREAREQLRRMEEERQAREAHSAYPQLDPKSPNFDPEFFEAVRDRLVANMYQGRQENLVDAAAKVSKFYKSETIVNKAKEQAINEFKEAEETKRQASRAPQGKPAATPAVNVDDLRARISRGDETALAERMKLAGL